NLEFFYYKNNYEIDFVIKRGKNIEQLIQVCFDLSNIATKQREIRGLLHGSKDLKCDNLLIITENHEGTEKVQWFGIKKEVKYIPLWKWLLEEAQ
ncbi:MAG: ATP-binding protein, partial [bacterium]